MYVSFLYKKSFNIRSLLQLMTITVFGLSLFFFFAFVSSSSASEEKNDYAIIIRKPENYESLKKIEAENKDCSVFVYCTKFKNIIPFSSLQKNKEDQKYISFRFKKLSSTEKELFEDAKDGFWNRFSIIDAALISEGIVEKEERNKYLNRYSDCVLDLKSKIVRYTNPLIRTRFVFEYMHRLILRGKYNLNLSIISEVFRSGNFNCVSATILYNALAREVGLDAVALETTGHAKSRVIFDKEFLDIETTCTHWTLLPDTVTDIALRNVIPKIEHSATDNSTTSTVKNIASSDPKSTVGKDTAKSASDSRKSTGVLSDSASHSEEIPIDKRIPVIKRNVSLKESVKNFEKALSNKSDGSIPSDRTTVESLPINSRTKTSGTQTLVPPQPQETRSNGKTQNFTVSRPFSLYEERNDKQSEHKDKDKKIDGHKSSFKRTQVWSGNRIMNEVNDVQLIATIFYNRGVDFYQERKCAEALCLYICALQLDPENETIWSNFKATLNNWAITLAEQNEFPEAIRLLEIGREIDPQFVQFNLNLPILFLNWIAALEADGQHQEAEGLKKMFAERFPNYKAENELQNSRLQGKTERSDEKHSR